jgi:hypothetical protein
MVPKNFSTIQTTARNGPDGRVWGMSCESGEKILILSDGEKEKELPGMPVTLRHEIPTVYACFFSLMYPVFFSIFA